MIGLAKLSIFGFEGSTAIFLSLFLKGNKLSDFVPSENKKLVSLGSWAHENEKMVEDNVKNHLELE